MSDQRPPTLDPVAAARWARHAAPASPWLHEEVARRMMQRLDWIRHEPASWVDWEPLRGGLLAHAELQRRYPRAASHVVESDAQRAQRACGALAAPWWSPWRWRRPLVCGTEAPAAGAQMLWANMGLHMAADPAALIGRWHEALAVDGFLMFSCLGPDTLRSLRDLYAAMGWAPPAHDYTDMHDWGDMLLAAGFAEPVMDMERIVLSFDTPQRLLQELRELGRNLHRQRPAGLRGRGWKTRLEQALAPLAEPGEGGRLTLEFEIIYGHAFKPAPRAMAGNGAAFSLEQMRSALIQRNRQRPSV